MRVLILLIIFGLNVPLPGKTVKPVKQVVYLTSLTALNQKIGQPTADCRSFLRASFFKKNVTGCGLPSWRKQLCWRALFLWLLESLETHQIRHRFVFRTAPSAKTLMMAGCGSFDAGSRGDLVNGRMARRPPPLGGTLTDAAAQTTPYIP